MLRCSIVMTTYNGSSYLKRQLDSLRMQNVGPYEVLIFDDCSSDDSAALVEKYIEDHKLENWKLFRNSHNLGWKANFMQGFDKTQGDLIFPCDQDDEWNADKIELMARAMEEHPDIMLLACDVDTEYEKGSVENKHYEGEETKAEGEIANYPLTTRFFMNPRPGCTYAIRKTFFDDVKEGWQADFPHDEYLWISAALEGKACFINKKLVKFYRHAGNSSDIRYKDIAAQKIQIDYISRSLCAFESLIKNGKIEALPEAAGLIDEAKIWASMRKKLMETRNPFLWLKMSSLHKYYNSNKNALSDLYLVIFGKFKR